MLMRNVNMALSAGAADEHPCEGVLHMRRRDFPRRPDRRGEPVQISTMVRDAPPRGTWLVLPRPETLVTFVYMASG